MSRTMARFALSLAAVGMLSLCSYGQEPGQGRGRGQGRGGMMGGGMGAGTLVMLASNEDVAKHLKLTDDQKAFLKLFGEELREESMKFFQGMRDLEPQEAGVKMREWAAKQGPEVDKKLAEILGDKLKRLKQIRVQTAGSMIFADPTFQKDLGITDEQKTKLTELQTAARDQMREIFQSAGDDPDARRKAMEDFQKEQTEKAMAILTDAQKTKLNELKGEPIDFKVDMRSMMGGGRGRGPGGPGGGDGGGENKRKKRSKKGSGEGKGNGDGGF